MKSFVSNFNATKKISITSTFFSLLFLFCSSICGFCGFASNSDSDEDSFHNSDSDVYSVRYDSSDCKEEDKNDTSKETDQKPHVTFVIDEDSSSTKTNASDNEQPQEDSLRNNGQAQGINSQTAGENEEEDNFDLNDLAKTTWVPFISKSDSK